MPAHKGGSGAPPLGVRLLGAAAYSADVSEMGGFDYLHDPGTPLTTAARRAAALSGAKHTWFLVNGATVGNLAAILGTVGDGDTVLVARGSHRSVYAGITLSGACPMYLPAVANSALEGLFGISADDVSAALAAEPSIRAVHVTNPSYYGFTIDLEAIAELTRAHGVPLIVDEAHGSHFALHRRFPRSALSLGADLVVHSPHKTLGSLTQSSLLHSSGELVDPGKIEGFLQMLQSSSPSALLLVSLDLAVDEMARNGSAAWGSAIELADELRGRINALPGLVAYGSEVVGTPGIAGFDPTKVVIDVSGLGTTGFAAAAWLKANARINPEFADLRRMVFSITFADDDGSIALLVEALGGLRTARLETTDGDGLVSRWPDRIPEMVMTPRLGAAAPSTEVALESAVGRVSAEMIVPYPPGVPLIVAGERISSETVAAIRQFGSAGSRLVGLADPSAATVRCVAGIGIPPSAT